MRIETVGWVMATFLGLALTGRSMAEAQPTPWRSETNRIQAAVNMLDSVDRRLSGILSDSPKGTTRNPNGVTGALHAISLQLDVAYERLSDAVAALPPDPETLPSDTVQVLQSLEAGASAVARRVVAVSSAFSTDSAIRRLAAQIEFVARRFASVIGVWFPPETKKIIPLRFVEAHDCLSGERGCDAYLTRDAIAAVVDALNESYGPAGLKFWPKSLERRRMPHFTSTSQPEDTKISWEDALTDLESVVHAYDLNPPPASPREPSKWIGYFSTVFSDRSELLIWLFDSQSVVGRFNGASVSSYPDGGRYSTLIASNVLNPASTPAVSPYHVVHELGHYFGLGHTWEPPGRANPYAPQTQVSWPDLWDLVWCPGDLGFPLSFSSREAAAAAANCAFQTIEAHPCPKGIYDASGSCVEPVEPNCNVGNRQDPSESSDMECTVAGGSYDSAEDLLKGLSFPMGAPEKYPQAGMGFWDDWSFSWGLNVMGYYSRYWAHLWVPGRFSVSQTELIKGHTTNNVPILANYAPFSGLTSDRLLLGADIQDYMWWSNKDFTFTREISPILVDDRVPIRGDFNGDGYDDIFWYRPGDAAESIWWADGHRGWKGAAPFSVSGYYTPVAGDFDGNGLTDILWYRPGPDSDPIWWFWPTGGIEDGRLSISGTYVPVVGNFDGVHGDDILWYDAEAGTANIWWSNGDQTFRHQDGVPVGAGFIPVAGDFDGDGNWDIFWYRKGVARDKIWWADTSAATGFTTDSGNTVQVNGWFRPIAGDFDGDGSCDIIWDRETNIEDVLWQGHPGRTFEVSRIFLYDGFRPVVGDFDGDGASDIFWYHVP